VVLVRRATMVVNAAIGDGTTMVVGVVADPSPAV